MNEFVEESIGRDVDGWDWVHEKHWDGLAWRGERRMSRESFTRVRGLYLHMRTHSHVII